MTEVVQLSDYRRVTTHRQGKQVKRKTTRPQNALSSADRAELDERIKSITRRLKNPGLAKQHITRNIRESCGVGRYFHITASQMTSYINELDSMEHRAYVFARVRWVFQTWDNRNLEKVFIDCDMDIDRFIERVIE
ncbi:MAG: hypothetical protein KZQ92_06735 [Candidatus Thiodiazotropha sp. (ex Lucinoma borealis)]|nr:hypothetical protein [Candidatus Thiodiazotropha sp. (ex Lucinoma borealis)]